MFGQRCRSDKTIVILSFIFFGILLVFFALFTDSVVIFIIIFFYLIPTVSVQNQFPCGVDCWM